MAKMGGTFRRLRFAAPLLTGLAVMGWGSGAAWSAPTCLNRAGDTVRCDRAGAMPRGWTLPPAEARARALAHPGPSAAQIWEAAGLLALFFALIALMPAFDGRRDQDWQ